MGFMVLTNSGHTAIATAVHDKDLFLAWGDLPAFIEPPANFHGVVEENTGGGLNSSTYEYVVTAVNEFGETTPSQVFNMTIANNNSSIVLDWDAVTGVGITYKVYGRLNGDLRFIASTADLTFKDTGLAISSGAVPPTANTTSASSWGSTPPSPSVSHSKLLREIGRRKVLTKKYVKPDPEGPYVTTQARWSESLVPTRHVYVYVAFDLNDAATSTLYQYGLFIDTTAKPGFENANYLFPDQVEHAGSMLSLENTTPIFRNPSTREIHEIVMTF